MAPSLAALVLRVRLVEAKKARRRWLVDRDTTDFRRLRRELPAVERAVVPVAEALPLESPERASLFFGLADLLAALS